MTVANEVSEVLRNWTGVEASFATGYQALSASDIGVVSIDALLVETALVAGVHYTAALDAGGYVTVTPVALPPAPTTLRISRVTPATQATSFAGLTDFQPTVHEKLHDASAFRDAELRRDNGKAFTAANSANASAGAAAASAVTAQGWAAQAQAYAGVPATGVFLTGSFTGNGATVAFDLGFPIVVAARVLWVEDGVPQQPGVDFTIAGNVVTRTTAPRNGAKIFWVLGGQMSGAVAASTVTDDSNVGTATVKTALNAIWAFFSGLTAGVVGASKAVVVDANKDIVGFRNVGITGQIQDTNANELLKLVATAAAVNELTLTNAATGGDPTLAATGGDANIAVALAGKGTGAVKLGQATSTDVRLMADQPIADSSGNEFLKFTKAGAAVNEYTVANAVTAQSPTIKPSGNDANISMRVGGKGAGLVLTDSRMLNTGAAPFSSNNAGNLTYTAAQILTGIIVRDCNGAARTDTLDTAANIVAAVPNAKVGDIIECAIVNGTNAAFAITVAAGAGGGFDANQAAATRIVGQNTSKKMHIRLTNVGAGTEAYVVYL